MLYLQATYRVQDSKVGKRRRWVWDVYTRGRSPPDIKVYTVNINEDVLQCFNRSIKKINLLEILTFC